MIRSRISSVPRWDDEVPKLKNFKFALKFPKLWTEQAKVSAKCHMLMLEMTLNRRRNGLARDGWSESDPNWSESARMVKAAAGVWQICR